MPHVTVIRPCKGIEPYLYECLAANFQQDYPTSKLTVYFCISSREDAAFPVIEKVVKNFPGFDVRVLVEEEDPLLQGNDGPPLLGPNPKIRNMSRAYREAKGDIVWILDCNIWVGRGACGRMVDKLCGFTTTGQTSRPYKLVHHLPISVEIDLDVAHTPKEQALIRESGGSKDNTQHGVLSNIIRSSILPSGSRLDELFLVAMHGKYYVAINTVAVVPAVVGKSVMFRRSHLNLLTQPANPSPASSETPSSRECVGIDHFSHNICEDQLIGMLFWQKQIPSMPGIGKHCLVLGDIAYQPVAGMSVSGFCARRVRWIRVRKFAVLVGSLMEPASESFLCSLCGAFAITTLEWFHLRGIPQTWFSFFLFWLCSVTIWAAGDWAMYSVLHSGRTVETPRASANSHSEEDEAPIPIFARPRNEVFRRPFSEWLVAWLVREALAWPIWMWAFYGGMTVVWREQTFRVGFDMRVHEIVPRSEEGKGGINEHLNGAAKLTKTGMVKVD